MVLSFWDPQNRCPTVDLFAEYPMNFETLFAQSVTVPLSGADVRIASVAHLVDIKRAAGRPRDLEDVARLNQLSRERLRRWSFQQRTPQQRLDWLVQALELAYQRGALSSDAEARS